MEPCKIEWITIPAPDLESAKTFYAEAFGFSMSKFNHRF
jgi:predicted enzyme related to lactoylglutathione lyase